MSDTKEAPREAGRISNNTCDANNTTGDKKWRRVLRLLRDGARLTRFDAERHGDHALNSTVSYLARQGVLISREPIVLRGRFGVVYCKRYWLEPSEIERADALLGGDK